MPEDDRWTGYLPNVDRYQETPKRQPARFNDHERPDGFEAWYRTNVYQQRQAGYAVVTVTLPLGDMSARQCRQFADIARHFSGDNIRTTVEQNIVLRWISEADLPDLYRELTRIGLAQPGAGTIVDVTACPGTDTCKLGIASSRGLAAEIRTRLAEKSASMDQAIRNLRIKVSGCFNSCGQHHAADIGFYGNSRNVSGYTVPHFQVMLGGQWTENAASYALAMGAVPSKAIPDLIT